MKTSSPWLGALAMLGCSASGTSDALVVGHDGAGGTSGGPSGSGGATLVIDAGAGHEQPFSAHVESPDGVTVRLVTLSCAGECADVLAVAEGGVPPYTYRWEDGSVDPRRHLCPSATTSYAVTATDTGVPSGEFRRDPYVAQASVTAEVLACPPPPSDAGHPPPTPGTLCLQNGSFEGTPAINVFGNFDAPFWQSCSLTPDVVDESTPTAVHIPASDGKTYLGLNGDAPSLTEAVAQKLCAPFLAGTEAHVLVDLALSAGQNEVLEFFGSNTQCAAEALLGTLSPTGIPASGWTTRCVTLSTPMDVSLLEIRFSGAGGPFLALDNLRVVEGCP